MLTVRNTARTVLVFLRTQLGDDFFLLLSVLWEGAHRPHAALAEKGPGGWEGGR